MSTIREAAGVGRGAAGVIWVDCGVAGARVIGSDCIVVGVIGGAVELPSVGGVSVSVTVGVKLSS